MTRCILAAVGCVATVTGAAVGQGERVLQRLDTGIEVSPIAVARAVLGPDGPRMVGDWLPYGGAGQRNDRVMVFDCIEQTGVCGDGYWFFGTGFSNLFVTNDMTVADDTIIAEGSSRADLAWYFTCDGASLETCIIALFTQESVPCDPDSFDYGGWLLDFGTLSCNPGGYYITNVDLDGIGTWPLPMTGTGSYVEYFLQEVTSAGAFVMSSLAQPMLWGTGDARGAPGAPGTQGIMQFDEVVVDQSHTSSECFTYSFPDACPDVLGPAMGFWGFRQSDQCNEADCNGDQQVDTQDFLCFLGLWAARDPAADCNNDGEVNTQDFLCFLGKWSACQ